MLASYNSDQINELATAMKEAILSNAPKIQWNKELVDSSLANLVFNIPGNDHVDHKHLVSEELSNKAMDIAYDYLTNVGSSNIQEIGSDKSDKRQRLTWSEIFEIIQILLQILTMAQTQLLNSKPAIEINNPIFIITESGNEGELESLIKESINELLQSNE